MLLKKAFTDLLPEDSGILGLDPSWIRIEPYQLAYSADEDVDLTVVIENPLPIVAEVAYRWVLPAGCFATPQDGAVRLQPGECAELGSTVHFGAEMASGASKRLILLDVTLNDYRLGQVAEAVVETAVYGPTSPSHYKGISSI